MTDADPTLWTLLLGTIAMRPYIFVFLLVYLFSNTLMFGLMQTLLFTVGGYILVFLAEYCSTRTGFPFGFYDYIETTRHQELWLSNVPFIVPLSFTFLAHASYMTALFLCAPLWQRWSDVQIIDTKAIRRSPSVLVLAVMLFVLTDIVMDPVTPRGSHWFLGPLYRYYETGVYFGVPLANFLGWAIVGLGLVTLHRVLDGVYRSRTRRTWGTAWVPYRGLVGPLLYLGVCISHVVVAFMIGERTLGVVDLFLLGPLVIFAWTQIRRPTNQATKADLEAHGEDFPASPLPRRLHARMR